MKENTDLSRVLDRMKAIPDEIIFFDGYDFITCPQFDFKGVNSHDLVAAVLYDYYKQDRSLDTFLDAYNFILQFCEDTMIPGIVKTNILAEVEQLLKTNKWKIRTRKARLSNSKTIRSSFFLPTSREDLPF